MPSLLTLGGHTERRVARRRRGAPVGVVMALLLAFAVGLLPWPAHASSPAPQAADSAQPPGNAPLASQGAYQLGKVRILGVPVITVAAPVISGTGNGPNAATRAQVIEGNLEMLYRGRNLCSGGEALAEALVLNFLVRSPEEDACGLANATLLGAPDAISVEVEQGEDGMHRLLARVAGRPQPLPLLTVTPEDARLNGLDNRTLALRWQGILQRRLRLARQLMQPKALLSRWSHVLAVEAILLVLLALTLALWQGSRKVANRWEDRFRLEGRRWTESLAIQGMHGLSFGLLLALSALLLTMAGVGVVAVPGQVPTALDLLLQPWGITAKLLMVWILSLTARAVLGLWLRQWVSRVNLPPPQADRRRQRYRSLRHVLRRLVDLSCLLLATVWILTDLPGVRELSAQVVLAGGALLGGLVLVFQGLFRDVAAGLKILFGDYFALGDTVEIAGILGEVSDLGLLSTELRCWTQRTATFPNSACAQVVNHTKLRSGVVVDLLLSHRCADLRQALGVIRAELADFASDPAWQSCLLEPPVLRGFTAADSQGLRVEVLLVTPPGAQGAAGRELRLRLLERLRRKGIPLAEGQEGAS